MRKAIFFDIDGTLINMNGGMFHLSERVKAALKNLQAAGHFIFIATGRPPAFMYEEILNFGFDGFVMTNGALVQIGGETVFEYTLDKSAVKKICDFAESENIEYMLEGNPYTYCPKNFSACDKFFGKIKANRSKIVQEFDIEKISCSKVECVTRRTDLENVDKIYKKILALPGFTGWADPFHFKSLELSSDKVTKATGILHALKYLGVDVKNSYAFGDGRNDYEMIQAVGTGFAMATGAEDFKKLAAHVVPSAKDDGVAVGIENYILGSD